jgi:hypothetical protein
MIAEIGKIEMGDVAVSPCDVHTRVCGDVDLDAGGFAAGMERNGHWKIPAILDYSNARKYADFSATM